MISKAAKTIDLFLKKKLPFRGVVLPIVSIGY
jgi:hypothetical protein